LFYGLGEWEEGLGLWWGIRGWGISFICVEGLGSEKGEREGVIIGLLIHFQNHNNNTFHSKNQFKNLKSTHLNTSPFHK